MAKPTLTQRMEGVEGQLAQILALLTPSPTTATVVEEEQVPEGNPIEYPPDAPYLTAVPAHQDDRLEDDDIEPQRSMIGAAFSARATASARDTAPALEWEPVGDTQMVVPGESVSSGHHLTADQITRDFLRDMRARSRPGMTVEDQYASRMA